MFFILFFMVGASIFNKYFHENIRSYPKMYCYEYFRGGDEPVCVVIINDLDLKERYLKYYKELEGGIEPYLDGIPLKLMTQYKQVYVVGYTKDSLLAEIVSYKRKISNDYTRGWVYAKTLHKNPPPENN